MATSWGGIHHNCVFSKGGLQWNYARGGSRNYIGGTYNGSNLSGGFHNILAQWWDFYTKGFDTVNVLLVSENMKIAEELKSKHPNWTFTIIDLFPELQTNSGTELIKADICSKTNPLPSNTYDLIINQATLEHVYNPFQAMENLCDSLRIKGLLITHTHPPAEKYHQYPRDYFRFMIDWWFDLEKNIKNIEVVEVAMFDDNDVCTCYRKV